MIRDVQHREQERLVALLMAVAAAAYAAIGPPSTLAHTDHVVFLGTVSRMRRGEAYYAAFRDAFRDDVNIRVGQPRAFREPAPFLLWRWLPSSALFVAFLAVVVLTVWLLAKASRSPFSALAAGAFLLLASRTTITEWMLVELWCAPLIAGCILAWKQQRAWAAAALAAGVFLVRETALPLLLAGVVLSIVQRRPRRPWVVSTVVAVALYGVHYVIAAGYTVPNGSESSLSGTGHPPESVFNMLTWPFQQERPLSAIVIALWAVAPIVVWLDRRTVGPLVGLLAIPAISLFIDRPYWGLLATPFALWLSTDRLVMVLRGWQARQGPLGRTASVDPA
jgi:hypothetical protein